MTINDLKKLIGGLPDNTLILTFDEQMGSFLQAKVTMPNAMPNALHDAASDTAEKHPFIVIGIDVSASAMG